MQFLAYILMALMVASPFTSEAGDEAGKKAEAFVQSRIDQALTFITDKATPFDQKKNKFRTILNDSFALKTIGRFSMGQHWRSLSANDQSKFDKLFEDYLVNVYSQRFNEYSGEKFDVIGSRAEDNGDVLVFSKLVPTNGSPVKIDWRVRTKNGATKVVDVIVEGISMSVTQRSDFSSVIQRSGGKSNAILEFLEKQNLSQS